MDRCKNASQFLHRHITYHIIAVSY